MSKHIEAPAVGSHTQEQSVQTDHPEHHLEMVKQEPFQAQQALLNEGLQRDKLLAALQEIADGGARNTPRNEKCTHDKYSFEQCEQCIEDFARAVLAEVKGDK